MTKFMSLLFLNTELTLSLKGNERAEDINTAGQIHAFVRPINLQFGLTISGSIDLVLQTVKLCSSKLDHCIHVLEKLKDAGRLVHSVYNLHCSVTTRSGLGNMSFLSVDSLDVEKSNVSEISMLY